jgi:hypothetical protein
MANRYFNQFQLSLEKAVVHLFARITFGSSGAPTLDAVNSKGIKSIARNSAGDYTITLQNPYNRLFKINHTFDTSGNSGSAPASPAMFLKAQAVSTVATPTVEVVFNAAGTATDPASGEAVLLHFVLKNTSV